MFFSLDFLFKMASCVAVIGKENSPLYIACSNPEQVRFAFMRIILDLSRHRVG